MAQKKKEIEPRTNPTGVEPEVRGSPLEPQPSPTGEGSPLEHSENKVYLNIRTVLVAARQKVYSTINSAMVEAYWEIGRQIEEAVGDRAEYGKGLLKFLSTRLTKEFGKGFDETNLRKMRQFSQVFPIRDALRLELSWTHYRLLMRIDNEPRREFYLKECAGSNWSSRQLERQITSFYYERLLSTQKEDKESVKDEIRTTEPKTEPDYILKDPYILEFLDLKENRKYHENELEQALIDNLQKFLLELGKGFSFVARQKRITIEGDHYYVDLVFYNYMLKCFVVIDLKTGKLSYQDIGQIDFYVRYFDDRIKLPEDNPTLGIILCADKNKTMAKYSVLSDKENLLASKYMLYLPTEEELKKELERERIRIESNLEENSDNALN
jgi:predicted nuclease of restriction endonuclease-like (RecB) superfamily